MYLTYNPLLFQILNLAAVGLIPYYSQTFGVPPPPPHFDPIRIWGYQVVSRAGSKTDLIFERKGESERGGFILDIVSGPNCCKGIKVIN